MSKPHGSSRAGTLLLGVGLSLSLGLLLHGAEPVAERADPPHPVHLGVSVIPVDPAVHRHLPATRGAGLTVQAVAPGSPAARAGLRRHDILLRWEDQWLFNTGQLRGLLRTMEPGQEHNCTILRQGMEERIELVLSTSAHRPPLNPDIRLASVPPAGWRDSPALALHLTEILQPDMSVAAEATEALIYEPERILGFQWRPAGDALRAQLGLANRNCVIIESIQAEAPAARAGLQPQDLVVALQGVDITTPELFAERLYGYTPGTLLNFRVWRGGDTFDVQMKLPPPVRADAAHVLSPVRPDGHGFTDDWMGELGAHVEWIILLESHRADLPFPVTAPISSATAQPTQAGGAAAMFDIMELPDGQGSIEIEERGGQKHYVVRDVQGSLRYEGPMATEADRLALRPLPTALRRAVEEFAASASIPPTPVAVRVWRWPVPSKDL